MYCSSGRTREDVYIMALRVDWCKENDDKTQIIRSVGSLKTPVSFPHLDSIRSIGERRIFQGRVVEPFDTRSRHWDRPTNHFRPCNKEHRRQTCVRRSMKLPIPTEWIPRYSVSQSVRITIVLQINCDWGRADPLRNNLLQTVCRRREIRARAPDRPGFATG